MYEALFPPCPFWFASEELLTDILRNEVHAVTQLLTKYFNLCDLFDVPEATVPQRAACFELLAHRKLMEIIYETFTQRYEESPSLGKAETDALRETNNLVSADAPFWVLEMNQVIELLPVHISSALPEALQVAGFDSNNAAQMKAIESAKKTLSNVDQFQALINQVLDQQLKRLQQRWSSAIVQVRIPGRRKGPRKRDKQRMDRDKLIAEIDDVAETLGKFLRLMDERKVKPQPTWNEWPGSWVQAYKNPRLRNLIHKDKSRALSRARAGRRN